MIPYGRKTLCRQRTNERRFEGSVIPYGRKTFVYIIEATLEFEGSGLEI